MAGISLIELGKSSGKPLLPEGTDRRRGHFAFIVNHATSDWGCCWDFVSMGSSKEENSGRGRTRPSTRVVSEDSLALIQTGFDHLDEGISMYDSELRLVAWNRAFVELIKFPDDLLEVGRPVSDLIKFNVQRGFYGKGDPEKILSDRLALLDKRERLTFDRVRSDGGIVAINWFPLPDGGLVITYREVTERRQAAEERKRVDNTIHELNESLKSRLELLTQRERELAETQRLSHVGSWEWNVADDTVVWSDEAYRIWGVERGEFEPTFDNITASIPPDEADFLAMKTQQAVETGESYELEHRVIHPDGSIRHVLERGEVSVWDEDGQPARLRGSMHDITEQRSAESAREKTSQLLGQIGKIQDDFIAGADRSKVFDGLLSVLLSCTESEYGFIGEILRDEAGEVFLKTNAITNISWNDETRAFYDKNAPAGMEFRNQESIFGKVIKTGELYISNDPSNDPNRCGLPKGHPALDSFLGIPFIKDGDFIGMAGIANRPGGYDEDVISSLRPIIATMTNQIQAWRAEKQRQSVEQALKESEEQLLQAQKMKAVGQLTGGVAHDFNNLLAVILGNVAMARERLGENERVQPLLDMIMQAGERGADLTQRLLAFSRQQVLAPVVIDLNEVLEDTTDLLATALGEHIEITSAPDTDLWRCLADRSQIENAILNLALNARDAMPQGGRLSIETANVTLDYQQAAAQADAEPGDFVMLSVSDTGQGIESENQEHIFEPFFTTKKVGEGSGLGLSMIYGFVKQSGGHMTVYSEVGEGTTLKIYLPRTEKALVERPSLDAASEKQLARETTILIVEDDPDVRTLIVALLSDMGYEIMEARSGPAALELLGQDRHIDLLLTDVVLPDGMTGPALAAKVRKDWPGIRVLFMSGYAEQEMAKTNRLEGIEAFLQKPFCKQDLADKVREILSVSAS